MLNEPSEPKVYGNHSGVVDEYLIADARLECSCGWSGTYSEAAFELFAQLYEVNCPMCDARIAIVTYPTWARVFEAAAEGYPQAILDAESLRAQGIYPES